MKEAEKVANILCFLLILFGEDSENLYTKILSFSPDYLIEKWERYIEASRSESPWGLHQVLREQGFITYSKRWGLNIDTGEDF